MAGTASSCNWRPHSNTSGWYILYCVSVPENPSRNDDIAQKKGKKVDMFAIRCAFLLCSAGNVCIYRRYYYEGLVCVEHATIGPD